MWKWLMLATAVAWVTARCMGSEPATEVRRVQTPVILSERDAAKSYRYLLSLPEGYDPAGSKRWPLLIYLHGGGPRKDDVWHVTRLGPPKIIEQPSTLSDAERSAARVLTTHFIVVSPHCPPGAQWEARRLVRLLDRAESDYKVDPERIYVTGASMGGFGTTLLASECPERLAAIAPVCGAVSPRHVLHASGRVQKELRRLPVWAFHCDKDPTVPLEASKQFIDAVHSLGGRDVRLTVFRSDRHDAWTRAYSSVELYAWLLKNTRTPAPAAAANPGVTH